MTESILSTLQCLGSLPPEWPEDLLSTITDQIRASGEKVVVLDDDPTGTQTVHDIAVLTTWNVDALAAELRRPEQAFYILTNSRSFAASDAVALNRTIGANLKQASILTGVNIAVVSRSDSTLRGHFPDEIDALLDVLEAGNMLCLIVPFFLEGGRYTVNDVHYVAEGDRLIPAGQTAYARDAVFGYHNSNLRHWVAEKTRGHIPCSEVGSISIDDIRWGGPKRVTELLLRQAGRRACIVNAASYRDLEVVVQALLNAERQGSRFICRTAASFVRVRTGIQPNEMIGYTEVTGSSNRGGLFVVGSYVPKTTEQVSALLTQTNVSAEEVHVDRLLNDGNRIHEIDRVRVRVNRWLENGRDVVIFTSRDLITGASDRINLDIGRRVSESLIDIVRGLDHPPRYIVAKGGITSSDMATKALNVRRAMVMGQILPGVPVWKLGEEARYPGMPFIVFPGNVGESDALARIQKNLARLQDKG